EALLIHFAQGVRKVAFGDIFLEDLRAYREKNLARIGMAALFPIWKHDTRELIRYFHDQRFRAVAVCIDTKVLDPSFAGRELTESFFRDLPATADPCGENGEVHTSDSDVSIIPYLIPLCTAASRTAPHPWNLPPVGALALFSGALLKDRRLAFVFPLVALFVGDIFIGFHKLLPIVYASFLVNVAIGLWLRDHRTIARIS